MKEVRTVADEEYKSYRAVRVGGEPICTVIARNEAEARQMVAEQLNRPGRYFYLRNWRAGGERVEGITA